MPLVLNGESAVLRWGYHQAAALYDVTVTKNDQGVWTLSSRLEHQHAFRLSQRPLVFCLTHAKGVWRWPVIELQIQGASLSAVLGPKESDHVFSHQTA